MPRPWLTEQERQDLLEMIARNDAIDIIGTGDLSDPPAIRWGKMWYANLLFQRASTGVSMRDTDHGIMEPIPVLQSLPYRLFNYRDESSIPFGVPLFPKNPGAVPIYMEKVDQSLGRYADLYFLTSDGKLRNEHGHVRDNTAVETYANRYGGGIGQFFAALQVKIMMNVFRGIDRALSGKEAFPMGLANVG